MKTWKEMTSTVKQLEHDWFKNYNSMIIPQATSYSNEYLPSYNLAEDTKSVIMAAAYRDYSSFKYVPHHINNIYLFPDKIFALLISFHIINPTAYEVSLTKLSISIRDLQWVLYMDIVAIHMSTGDRMHMYTYIPLGMATVEQRNFLFNNLQYLRSETQLTIDEVDYNEI